jgi:hypothetical protein
MNGGWEYDKLQRNCITAQIFPLKSMYSHQNPGIPIKTQIFPIYIYTIEPLDGQVRKCH